MAKRGEAQLRVKNKNLDYFDAKLRFALLVSLRSASFLKISNRQLISHFNCKGYRLRYRSYFRVLFLFQEASRKTSKINKLRTSVYASSFTSALGTSSPKTSFLAI